MRREVSGRRGARWVGKKRTKTEVVALALEHDVAAVIVEYLAWQSE